MLMPSEKAMQNAGAEWTAGHMRSKTTEPKLEQVQRRIKEKRHLF